MFTALACMAITASTKTHQPACGRVPAGNKSLFHKNIQSRIDTFQAHGIHDASIQAFRCTRGKRALRLGILIKQSRAHPAQSRKAPDTNRLEQAGSMRAIIMQDTGTGEKWTPDEKQKGIPPSPDRLGCPRVSPG